MNDAATNCEKCGARLTARTRRYPTNDCVSCTRPCITEVCVDCGAFLTGEERFAFGERLCNTCDLRACKKSDFERILRENQEELPSTLLSDAEDRYHSIVTCGKILFFCFGLGVWVALSHV